MTARPSTIVQASAPSTPGASASAPAASQAAATATFSLLAIDDNPSDLDILKRLVRKVPEWNVEFASCTEAKDGLAHLERHPVDLVLVDYRLGAINGIELLDLIRKTRFEGAIIVLTGQGDERLAAQAMRSGAADYMPKSDLTAASLRRAVENALERSRLQIALAEHQHRLERMNEDLQQKNQEIRSFYHTLSHELKTPLTAAREFVSILVDGLAGELSPTQIEYLGYVKEGCDQMTTCLNDILDITRMETGRFSVRTIAAPLPPVVHRTLAGFANRARDAGIELEEEFASNLPEAVFDPHRLTQVVGNLIDNAIKFTPPGGKVRLEVGTGSDGRILVTVTDTGKGIHEEHLEHVFERLYQVRDGSEQSRMGLGLGLFICREIVRLHGGELAVASRVGAGTTFRFTLPTSSASTNSDSQGDPKNHG
jgi:signal transduction histidine kinase